MAFHGPIHLRLLLDLSLICRTLQEEWIEMPCINFDGVAFFLMPFDAGFPLSLALASFMVRIMQPPVPPETEMLISSRQLKANRPGCGALLLRHRADRRSIGFLLALSALFIVQWTGAMRYWALLPLTCLFAFIACIIKHNHIHSPTFARESWNRALDYLLGFCTGQSTAAIIPVHQERHHEHSQTQEDFVRSSIVNFRHNWLNLLAFPFVVVWLVHRNKSADLARWRLRHPRLYQRVQRERAAVLLLVLVLTALNWRATLLYLGIPWLFGQWGIVTINLLQHQDCDESSAYDHSRNITGRWTNWLFLNNGFHTAHHLRPALHWSRLAEFHRLHVAPKIRPELNHRSLLVCAWTRFFRTRRPNMS
jgi:fatty acid desaturase